jgi:hypothetical protein
MGTKHGPRPASPCLLSQQAKALLPSAQVLVHEGAEFLWLAAEGEQSQSAEFTGSPCHGLSCRPGPPAHLSCSDDPSRPEESASGGMLSRTAMTQPCMTSYKRARASSPPVSTIARPTLQSQLQEAQ